MQVTQINAKPLIYQGTTFDKAEELQWAVLLSDLRIKWAYKPKEFKVKGESITPSFLCQFYSKRGPYKSWIHIALGIHSAEYLKKLHAIAKHTGHQFVLFNQTVVMSPGVGDMYFYRVIKDTHIPIGIAFNPDSKTARHYHPQALNKKHPDTLIRAIKTVASHRY